MILSGIIWKYMELLDKHTCFQQAYPAQVELFVLIVKESTMNFMKRCM